MSKRGQVFILAAILIAVILFSLSAVKNKSEQKEIKGDFDALAENFQIESSRLINSAIDSGVEVHGAFKSFSTMFTSYAKGKNPEYGLIYVFSFGDKIQVTNFLERVITLQGCNPDTGEPYSINISGGFGAIPADVNFEDFNIKISEVPADLEIPCETIPSLTGEIVTSKFCAFISQPAVSTKTDLMVVIDGAPYYLCVEKDVPEIMQVSLMRQGEQAKVKGTGECIDQDFCRSFTTEQSCKSCGKGSCCWWPGGKGVCISSYTYPNRCGDKPECYPTDEKLCLDDSTIYYYDSCGKPAPDGLVETCDSGEVCRDVEYKINPPQCCVKESVKKCSGNDIYWFSSCGTLEDKVEKCQDKYVCHDEDDDLAEAKCCKKEDHNDCYENNIYWYSDCKDLEGDYVQEALAYECDKSKGWVCRVFGPGARCCLQNYEKKCNVADNNLYYYDSCDIKGDMVEDCTRYCDAQNNRCCVKQQGQKCSADSKKICDYYDDCGKVEDCNTDCDAEGKYCSCDANGCKCVTKIYKQFLCRTEYWTDWGDCDEDAPDCEEGYTCVDTEEDDCWEFWEEERCLCRKEVWTDCVKNPACDSGYTKVEEKECEKK